MVTVWKRAAQKCPLLHSTWNVYIFFYILHFVMFVWMAALTTVSSHSIWEKTETYELKYYQSTWVDVMNQASAHRCDQVRQGGGVSDKAARSVWTHLSRQLRNRNAQQTGKCCTLNTETSTARHLWFDQPYACSVRCAHSVASSSKHILDLSLLSDVLGNWCVCWCS